MHQPSQVLDIPTNPGKPEWRDLVKPKHFTAPKPCEASTIEGWDTETRKDGRAFILANSSEWRKVESFDDIKAFLMGRSARNVRNFWWNLDFDVTAMLKWRTDILETVVEEGRWDDGTLKVSYIPNKLLKFSQKGHTTYHYDIMQFYNSGLEKAAKKYLGKDAPDIKHDRANLEKYALDEVGRYCQWDAGSTRELAELFVKKLHAIDIKPKHFISKGNVAQFTLLSKHDVPTWRDIPERVCRRSWKSFRAGWVDLWKRGSMPCWKYDITSAYPAVMRDLPDFRKGLWVEEECKEAFVGVARCVVRMRKDTPPMIATWLDATHYYPTFDAPVRCWLTLPEVRFLRTCADVKVEACDSFVPKENTEYPWRSFCDTLFKVKEENRGDPGLYQAAKETFNSGYGKMCERVKDKGMWRMGRLFNPVAATIITSQTRVWVAQAIQGHLDDIIAIATDSLTCSRPVSVREGSTMGAWKVEAEGLEGVFVQPGIYQVEGERAHTRGFKAVDDFKRKLRTSKDTFDIKYVRPWTSREAVHHNDIEKANVFESHEYEVKLSNARRLWKQPVHSFAELLKKKVDSRPVPISLR